MWSRYEGLLTECMCRCSIDSLTKYLIILSQDCFEIWPLLEIAFVIYEMLSQEIATYVVSQNISFVKKVTQGGEFVFFPHSIGSQRFLPGASPTLIYVMLQSLSSQGSPSTFVPNVFWSGMYVHVPLSSHSIPTRVTCCAAQPIGTQCYRTRLT